MERRGPPPSESAWRRGCSAIRWSGYPTYPGRASPVLVGSSAEGLIGGFVASIEVFWPSVYGRGCATVMDSSVTFFPSLFGACLSGCGEHGGFISAACSDTPGTTDQVFSDTPAPSNRSPLEGHRRQGPCKAPMRGQLGLISPQSFHQAFVPHRPCMPSLPRQAPPMGLNPRGPYKSPDPQSPRPNNQFRLLALECMVPPLRPAA